MVGVTLAMLSFVVDYTRTDTMHGQFLHCMAAAAADDDDDDDNINRISCQIIRLPIHRHW